MRFALVLVLVVGCAQKSAERRSPEPSATVTGNAAAPMAEQTTQRESQEQSTATVGAAPGGPSDGVSAGGGSAIDQARASGVLGPTDQHAFAIAGKVTVKTASTKDLDASAKASLDAVKACYDKALEYKDTLAGELTISVNKGKATVAKTTLKNPELEKCVVEALTALPASGKATLVLAFKRE